MALEWVFFKLEADTLIDLIALVFLELIHYENDLQFSHLTKQNVPNNLRSNVFSFKFFFILRYINIMMLLLPRSLLHVTILISVEMSFTIESMILQTRIEY